MPNIAITNYCNLHCPYCFANEFIQEEKQEIQLEQIDSILQFLSKSNNIERIGIIGGEPTLHSNIEEVLNKFVSFSSANNNIPIVIFSNGIHINRISKFLNKNCSCLINLNEPLIVGQEKWDKILFNLEKLKANGSIQFINFGINLYPDIKDFEYIFKVAKNCYKDHIRCSFVAPTCNYVNVNKDDYYNYAKQIFLNFVKKADEYNVRIELDCNHVPKCYFSEDELAFLEKKVVKWHSLCNPVVDITANGKATSCFGSYDPVDIYQFETLEELTEYLKLNKMCPLQEKNSSGKCLNCEQFKNKECQGGCLAFAKNQQNI